MALTDRWTNPTAILVATDLSDLDRLMPVAFEMAGETGASLLVLHVLPASASITADTAGMLYCDPVAAVDYAESAMEPWCKLARTQGIECEMFIRQGNAAREIVSAVRSLKTDRLLLGTRSRSKLGKLLLGSVAEQVLRSVTLPVITVGPEAHLPSAGSNRNGAVLHATTLGETSRASAALACQIAASHQSRLILLHVLPQMSDAQTTGSPSDLDASVLHELHNLAVETCATSRIHVEERVSHGNPAIEILVEAAESDANLIVLGSMPHSAFESLIRDRTVYRVLAHAKCPVLILPHSLAKSTQAEIGELVATG